MDKELEKFKEIFEKCGISNMPTDEEIKSNALMIQNMLQSSEFADKIDPVAIKSIDWAALFADIHKDVQQQLPELIQLYDKVKVIIEANPKLSEIIEKVKNQQTAPEKFIEEVQPEFPQLFEELKEEMKKGELDTQLVKNNLPTLLEIVKKHMINHNVPMAAQIIGIVTDILSGKGGQSTNLIQMFLNRNKKKLTAPERQQKRINKTRREVRANLKREQERKNKKKKNSGNRKKKKK